MNYELRDSFIKKIKPHPAEVELPPSVREVADHGSDEGSQYAYAQAAWAHTFVPVYKSMQKRPVAIHCFLLFKYTLSPPSTANLPKRFGLQALPDTHQCRSISLFIKSLPACVCWFPKRVSFTDGFSRSDKRVGRSTYFLYF